MTDQGEERKQIQKPFTWFRKVLFIASSPPETAFNKHTEGAQIPGLSLGDTSTLRNDLITPSSGIRYFDKSFKKYILAWITIFSTLVSLFSLHL